MALAGCLMSSCSICAVTKLCASPASSSLKLTLAWMTLMASRTACDVSGRVSAEPAVEGPVELARGDAATRA